MNYLDRRDLEIDLSEWIDIYYSIKALGVGYNDKIVELCAGKGYLIQYLKEKGYKEVIGVDLEGCKYSNDVICIDLNKEYPPEGDVYIFQHCIEHLNQNRVVQLLRHCLNNGEAIIGIVPAHKVNDPTHIVNHYHYEDLLEMIKKINPPYWYIRPDLMSYVNPVVLDYLIIMSNKPFNPKRTFPLIVRYSLGFSRKMINMYTYKLVIK